MPGDFCVRDRLFLLAHDEDRGFRPRIHLRTLGVGLSGAVLIDLVAAGRIHVAGNKAAITDLYDHRQVGDPIDDHALATVRASYLPPPASHTLPPAVRPGSPSLRDLITRMAAGIYERTLGGLVAAGLVTHTRIRLGRSRYQPADQTVLVHAGGAIRDVVAGRSGADEATDGLCALIRLLRLHDALYLGDPSQVDPGLAQASVRLQTHATQPCTDILAIVAAIDAAIGDITVAVYR